MECVEPTFVDCGKGPCLGAVDENRGDTGGEYAQLGADTDVGASPDPG